MNDILRYISTHKIIAVIRDANFQSALKTCYTLIEGGIKIIEISLLTKNAFKIINKLRKENIFVGAGTIQNENEAQQVIDAGSLFNVSPYIDEKIIKLSLNNNIVASAGCVTPNEINLARKLGVHIYKIFPAHAFGGLKYLKSLIDIFPDLQFMPTGGVNIDNFIEYIKIGVFSVGMSESLIPKRFIDTQDFDKIKENANHFVKLLDNYNSSIH